MEKEEFFVQIDQREPSVIAKRLEDLGAKVEYKILEVGDYVIGDICIERKEASDYLSSLMDGRLNNQLASMSYNFEISFLIVEGFIDEALMTKQIKKNQYLSSFAGSVLKRNPSGKQGYISMINVSTPFDTAYMVYAIYQKLVKGDTARVPRVVKKDSLVEAPRLSVFMSLPDIGEIKARSLMDKFKTIEGLVFANESDIADVKGIGKNKAHEIYKLLHTTESLHEEDLKEITPVTTEDVDKKGKGYGISREA